MTSREAFDVRLPGSYAFGLRRRYPLTKAALFAHASGWHLWAHCLVLGPVAVCVVWKAPKTEEQVKEEAADAKA